jgi:hypothetical protein
MTITHEPITDSKRNDHAEPSGSGIDRKIRNRARDAQRGARPGDGAENSTAPSDSTTRSTTPLRTTLGSHVGGRLRGLGARLHASSPYSDRPASIRDVVSYTAAGGWIPGEHDWWWESPGYAWGVVIAIPLAVVGNSILWITHKFGRAMVAGLIFSLLWFVSFLPPDLSFCAQSWRAFGLECYAALIALAFVAVISSRPRGSTS